MLAMPASRKWLLRLRYECDVSFSGSLAGPEDGWIVYEGSEIPHVGESGFGIHCSNYISIQECGDSECAATGGIVYEVEPYTLERAVELGLEE